MVYLWSERKGNPKPCEERKQQHLVAEALHRHERLHRLVNDSAAASHAEMIFGRAPELSRKSSDRNWLSLPLFVLHRASAATKMAEELETFRGRSACCAAGSRSCSQVARTRSRQTLQKIHFRGSFSTMLTVEMFLFFIILFYPYLWPGRLAIQADPWR